MANLTIRQLDEETKRKLRLRAAANGRSMEDETRTILRELLSVDRSAAGPRAPRPVGAAPAAMSGARPALASTPAALRRTVSGLAGASILLVIGGGVAAYKSLDLIRRLRERGAKVRVVMTKAAQEFVTPLSVGALTGGTVFTELFAREAEHDVGHIRLAREADLVIVAPATADRLAKMAAGIADDLAGAVLLATRAPVLLAPAMNPAMWSHPATQRSVATLAADGALFIGPNAGEMAESGEAGIGRMAEPLEILAAAEAILTPRDLPLAGRHVVVTSGPTHEPIDPVRYLANRSSGKQGHAIAAAAAAAGARVTLVAGPVAIPDPPGVEAIHVETAAEMLAAVERALPADIAIMAAAVADWRAATRAGEKIKKGSGAPPRLALAENPDILATVAHLKAGRPRLVVGFAAETSDLLVNATAKRRRKGADWILANDVSGGQGMGQDDNTVHLVTEAGVETWPTLPKEEVASLLVARLAAALGELKEAAE
ncbi:MAG: bifunctional phosphopantothenoylcysteine decarboxylase/phosphopantothenate--cysteine ligase CoaBC [Bauldia sp.]|nr:bifunctional phosphopantothenoylcysteine decarboxylase/phosphopantothenate--cysteine ligase CoaBC [Bauldia sp.]